MALRQVGSGCDCEFWWEAHEVDTQIVQRLEAVCSVNGVKGAVPEDENDRMVEPFGSTGRFPGQVWKNSALF
jgi:hypothetical protein